ncbi:MAG: HipA N-terminal domain-containing protein, partial [Oligoflexia bacterium]|nr:HipA N-terminal domain-containing protein [Oligoflexia bacterium]
MYKAVDVYLERKNTRQYVGRLQIEERKFVFQYDKSYLQKDNPISLGPDLPLQLNKLSSSKLFPSFADRIPSKKNPAYKEYCLSVGISPFETNPLALLAKLGQKGPSSFVCAPVEEKQFLSSEDLKLFRKSLKLSIREFSDLFGISSATIYRIENNKTSGKDTLKKLEVYYKSPQAILEQIKITGNKINESKKFFIENLLKSKIIEKQQVPIGPFTVSSEDIKKCNPQQFVELIKRLSLAECYQYNIPQNSVDFSSNITAKDGGQDGLVNWSSQSQAPAYTNYFPNRYNCFQIKASSLSPKECKKEILDKDQKLKPALEKVIKKRGAYILCSTHLVSGVYLTAREEAIYEEIKKAGYDPDLIQIKFYSADKIANWLNKFPSLAVWFLKEICGKEKYPWLSWKEWSREDLDYRSEFMFHEVLKNKQKRIYNILTEPRKTVHLAGASGTGKTRLALEAFRPISNETAVDLSHLVLYSSAENLNTFHLRELKTFRVILVIDDCSLEKAEPFHKIAVQEDSQFSLLTIGNEETEQGLQYIIRQITEDVTRHILKLEPDKEITTKMLLVSQDISNKYLDPEYHILTSGFPLMATLLRDVDPIHLLKDDIPTIKKKMLWRRAEPDKDGEKVIKACSLFDTIGITNNENMRFSSTRTRGKEEAEYIAEKICNLDYETFYEKIQFFKKKKIIQQYGDFIQVRPKPLSVWLASEFIEQTPPEILTKWLTEMKLSSESQELSLEDKKQLEEWQKTLSDKKRKEFNKFQEDQLILHDLRDSFCKQLSYLSSYETAKNLVKQLCDEIGIFGKKENLCAKGGFRCLYHLVDLNPEVVLQTLERIFRDKQVEELKELTTGVVSLTIGKTVFPELIWILQKLAREKKLYLRAGRLLLRLAEIDIDSSMQSQARQVYVNHFQLYLSGTSACPKEKFKIIEEIKSSKSIKQKEIAIEAINEAMRIGGWTCSSDLMKTNSDKKYEHYQPKTYKEERNYFRVALDHLIYFSSVKESSQEIQKKACSIIAGNLRSLLKQNLYKPAKEAIKAVVSVHGSHWPLAKDSLLRFLKYNPKITEDNKKQVKEMLELLQPGPDLNERIRSYITECPSDILYNKRKKQETKKYDKCFNQLIIDFADLIEKGALSNIESCKSARSNQDKSICSSDLDLKKIIPESKKSVISKKIVISAKAGIQPKLEKQVKALETAFKLLFHGEQRNTFSFGEKLAEKLENPWKSAFSFLSLTVKWKNNENFNPIFLSGFVAGLKNCDSNKTKKFLDHLTTESDLADFLIDTYNYIPLQDQDIERLINVIHKINLKPTDLRELTAGQRCQSVSPKLIEKLILILMEKGVDYSWTAIQIYNYYVYNRSWEEKKQLLSVLYKLLTRDNLFSKKYNVRNEYLYVEAVEDVLKSEYKELFSKKFLSQIFNSEVSIFNFAISDDEIKECCKKIVQTCPDIFLQEATKYIDNPNVDFIFKDGYSSFPSELDSKNSLFSDLPEDSIKKWCEKAPNKVPVFLARSINLFDKDGSLSSLSKFLLDEYGDQTKLIEAISLNLGNFS